MKEIKLTKIFITGASGAGKTTLAQLITNNTELPYIYFDETYNYALARANMFELASSPVFNAINRTSKYVIDALPATNSSDKDKFSEYLKKNKDCSIIVVKCSKETWLKRKPETAEDELYDNFYNAEDNLVNAWLNSFEDMASFYFYNSDTSTFCNSKEELYSQT